MGENDFDEFFEDVCPWRNIQLASLVFIYLTCVTGHSLLLQDKAEILKYVHPPVLLLGSPIRYVGSVGLMPMLIRTTLI